MTAAGGAPGTARDGYRDEDAVPDPHKCGRWCAQHTALGGPLDAAVPDPRFRDQLADKLEAMLTGATGIATRGYWQRRADALLPLIAAEVEARVQAAGDQRAAEELEALVSWVFALRGPVLAGAASLIVEQARARAAALASPAPATQTGGGQ